MVYDFCCENCARVFDIVCSIDEVSSQKPKCPNCKSGNTNRNWSSVTLFGPNKTLGSLADKNTKDMSQDYKDLALLKQNEYRLKKFTGKLPDGAKLTREQ